LPRAKNQAVSAFGHGNEPQMDTDGHRWNREWSHANSISVFICENL
jgi:hypothetical protein